jgi:hypothetical protein
MKHSKKLFHRLIEIPFGEVIHISRNSGKYLFIGLRNRRKNKECVVYTVPNNVKPENLNIKAIERAEFDLLWSHLIRIGSIRTNDFRILTPELVKEGTCCVSAFYGMINKIYPGDFGKGHGIIKKKG